MSGTDSVWGLATGRGRWPVKRAPLVSGARR
jgi:hypothetical protein